MGQLAVENKIYPGLAKLVNKLMHMSRYWNKQKGRPCSAGAVCIRYDTTW